jgi:glucokinase
MPAERRAVGVDVGGSKLRGGLVSPDGQSVARLEREMEAWKGPAGVLAHLKGLITRLFDSIDRAGDAGIGIAAGGQIHRKTHAVVPSRHGHWPSASVPTAP